MNHSYNKKCSCDKCKCISMKNKLNKYKEMIKDLIDYNELDDNNDIMTQSIIVEKDNEGNYFTTVKSNLDENFLVLNDGKDLDELTRVEYNSINQQNNYYKLNKITKYINNFNLINSLSSTVINIGKYIFLF